MATNYTPIKGNIRAIQDRVIVKNMYFGEQTTKGGIILGSDDGKTRGIYPRWGQVHSKGPLNKDPYEVGDWILVEHGRWTRGINIDNDGDEFEMRMVDTETILAYSAEKPDEVQFGQEYSNATEVTVPNFT